jgi:hypothetical protein
MKTLLDRSLFNRFRTFAVDAAMLAQALAHRAMGGKVPVTFGQPG